MVVGVQDIVGKGDQVTKIGAWSDMGFPALGWGAVKAGTGNCSSRVVRSAVLAQTWSSRWPLGMWEAQASVPQRPDRRKSPQLRTAERELRDFWRRGVAA